MKAARTFRAKNTRPRSALWIALLLLCALATHALDACAAHLALPEKVSQVAFADNCDKPVTVEAAHLRCSHSSEEAPDLCEVTSEVSTAAAHTFDLDAPPLSAASPLALATDFFALDAPVQLQRSRDGPDVPSLVSLCLRSTLPGRSPPFSA